MPNDILLGNPYPSALDAEEFIKDQRFVVHRWNGRAAIVPRAAPAAIVDTQRQKRKACVGTDVLREDLIQRNRIGECWGFGAWRTGEKRLLRVVIAGRHARMKEILSSWSSVIQLFPATG